MKELGTSPQRHDEAVSKAAVLQRGCSDREKAEVEEDPGGRKYLIGWRIQA